ncbi:MAG TPA: hypothetical protein VIW01_04245 [Dehalococcoidia bacterium]
MKREILRRSGFASAAAVFILFGAVLPNMAFLGHIQLTPSHSHATHEANAPQDTGEEHTLHCHAGPSSCAGAQSMVGSIWVGEDSGLIDPAAETRATPDSSQPITPDAPVFRLLKPPRAA